MRLDERFTKQDMDDMLGYKSKLKMGVDDRADLERIADLYKENGMNAEVDSAEASFLLDVIEGEFD